MKYIENIIIGKPIVSDETIFGVDGKPEVWEEEKEKTIWTDERFLPKLLGGTFVASYIEGNKLITEEISLNIAPSQSEVRRNRKDLIKSLDSLDYIEIKYWKSKLFILVGE